MRAMVTGGAGFIGSHVADALLADGHDVCVVDDLSTGRRENVPTAATFAQVDIRDEDALERVFADFRPDLVSHQAAQTSVSASTREPRRDAEINVLGGLSVLERCVRHPVRHLVFASTGGAIYGEVPDGTRAGVDWTPRPLSPYACSKLAFEAYLEAYRSEHGLSSTVLRYANVYGPRQDPHGEAGVVAIFCQRLLAGQSISVNARKEVGDPGCVRDYVYVGDVVRANRAAVSGALSDSPFNVGTGVGTTTLELARELERVLGIEADIRHAPRREGDVERSVLEPGSGGGVSAPTPLAEGLAQTVAWFRDRATS